MHCMYCSCRGDDTIAVDAIASALLPAAAAPPGLEPGPGAVTATHQNYHSNNNK